MNGISATVRMKRYPTDGPNDVRWLVLFDEPLDRATAEAIKECAPQLFAAYDALIEREKRDEAS